jgi:GTPase
LVTQGIITEGMSLNLGPFEDGTFRPVVVTSIKRNRAPCRLVRATQSAALAIECQVNDVRKGMVLVDTRAEDIQCTMLFKVMFFSFLIFLIVLTKPTLMSNLKFRSWIGSNLILMLRPFK